MKEIIGIVAEKGTLLTYGQESLSSIRVYHSHSPFLSERTQLYCKQSRNLLDIRFTFYVVCWTIGRIGERVPSLNKFQERQGVLMIMSEESEADVSCCASCGITEIDDIKLVPCDGCDLVRYCSDECRQDHKSEHEEVCENGPLSYEMNYYLSNRRSLTQGTVPSA